MATQTGRPDPKEILGDAPTETFRGAGQSLLMVMTGLGASPPTGRLLRGFAPWLDAQETTNVYLLAERKWREPWRDGDEMVAYQEIVFWERGPRGGIYRGAAWKNGHLPAAEIVRAFQIEPTSVVEYAARRMEAAVVSSRAPLQLAVHYEQKPWGREGWYTGIEKRGVSRVRSASGTTELPYALGMFPVPLIGAPELPPILLKTLEPHPEAVLGDLYLEVHEEKWETYVVLEIDPVAWPRGVGEVRAGLAPKAIERYRTGHGEDWAAALTADLQERIGEYERVRREIDARIDEALCRDEEDTVSPISPERHAEMMRALPRKLAEEERRRRRRVEAFLGKTSLRVGDVVSLPPGVIHSLRHGVRVVEFQTPTYERLIAMFTQKVLTQSHWNTERALARMEKAPYVFHPPEPREARTGCRVERAVSYPAFTVDRMRLERSRKRKETLEGGYHLLFVVQGTGRLILPDGTSQSLVKEDALLLPLQMGGYEIACEARDPIVWLKAVPRTDEEGGEG